LYRVKAFYQWNYKGELNTEQTVDIIRVLWFTSLSYRLQTPLFLPWYQFIRW